VIDVGDDREIADVCDGDRAHGAQITSAPSSGKRRRPAPTDFSIASLSSPYSAGRWGK
jgi:hypothetical protein